MYSQPTPKLAFLQSLNTENYILFKTETDSLDYNYNFMSSPEIKCPIHLF